MMARVNISLLPWLQARKNAKAAGQAFYDVQVLQALAGTLGSALPESLRPRASALSPHQVCFLTEPLQESCLSVN